MVEAGWGAGGQLLQAARGGGEGRGRRGAEQLHWGDFWIFLRDVCGKKENQRAMGGMCRVVSDYFCNPQPDSWFHSFSILHLAVKLYNN